MSAPRKLIIVGAGGAGLEALFVARRMKGWEILGFADDAPALAGKAVGGAPVLGTLAGVASDYAEKEMHVHFALGKNALRMRAVALFEGYRFRPATLIDPSAVVADSSIVGEGDYVAPNVFVGPQARLGRHVLVNVGASIGHHSHLDEFVQICPGACVSGNARLGAGAFIGSNAVVAPGVRVGAWALVGAASLAARDVPDHFSAIGVPARALAVPGSK